MIVPVPVCKSCRLGIGTIHIASSSVNPRTPMNQQVESSLPAVETEHIHPMCLHSLLRWPFHGVSLLCRTSGNSRLGSCLPTLAIRIESQSCLHLHISNRGRANRVQATGRTQKGANQIDSEPIPQQQRDSTQLSSASSNPPKERIRKHYRKVHHRVRAANSAHKQQ